MSNNLSNLSKSIYMPTHPSVRAQASLRVLRCPARSPSPFAHPRRPIAHPSVFARSLDDVHPVAHRGDGKRYRGRARWVGWRRGAS